MSDYIFRDVINCMRQMTKAMQDIARHIKHLEPCNRGRHLDPFGESIVRDTSCTCWRCQ